MNSIRVTSKQSRLDALHPVTLMIKKTLPQIINCYVEPCVPESHLKGGSSLRYAEFAVASVNQVRANEPSFIGMFSF